jgi:hypothetical protein
MIKNLNMLQTSRDPMGYETYDVIFVSEFDSEVNIGKIAPLLKTIWIRLRPDSVHGPPGYGFGVFVVTEAATEEANEDLGGQGRTNIWRCLLPNHL